MSPQIKLRDRLCNFANNINISWDFKKKFFENLILYLVWSGFKTVIFLIDYENVRFGTNEK